MIYSHNTNNFPNQKVTSAEKAKPEWYANCIDWIIDAGISMNDRNKTKTKFDILHGEIPDSYYKKTLNPYNSAKEKYTRFPATMRNYDIMSDIIRRYVSEYIKSEHIFTVGSNNPNLVINKNKKLREQVNLLAQQTFVAQFQAKYNEAIQEAQQNGQNPEEINPQNLMPNIDEFIKKFEEDYIDEESKKGQDLLDYIRSITEDLFIYTQAYFNYVSVGECYTYTDIRGDKIVKECINPIDAYPIPNSSFFVEDHDMFARKTLLTYQQVLDMFDDYLTNKDKKYLDECYNHSSSDKKVVSLTYEKYFQTYPDVCGKFGNEERELFKDEGTFVKDRNTGLIEVWHTVWRGMSCVGIVTYINEIGMQSEKTVDEDYKLNPEAGDIEIKYIYIPQVYEGYRIGTRNTAVYPIKSRAVLCSRNGKLPYNGVMEILPGFGKFSIIEIISPFQIFRNIIAFHREMIIAKNKMLILIIPQSLVASNSEDKIYKMAADGVLMYDDTEDSNSLKAQQIRLLNANLNNYISELTQLYESVKLEARELVDMNEQRYGQIAQSAGVQNTQEAIARSSMGSILIINIFDELRKRDYNRDIDYAKIAFSDGVNEAFWNDQRERKFISIDADSLLSLDLSTTVNNSEKDKQQLEQLRQWAFNASQNGELDMAIEAITNNNIAAIKKNLKAYSEIKRKHEEDMQQMESMLKQQEIQTKLQEIAAKGEEDRKTLELKYYYEMQMQNTELNMDILRSPNPEEDNSTEYERNRLEREKLQAQADNETVKNSIQREKLNLDKIKIQADLINKAADRQVKRDDMNVKLKIAKTNKNKYDK